MPWQFPDGDEIATILDLLVPEQYQGERIANCSVTVLTYKDGYMN